MIFRDDDHIPELCEKWIYLNGNYAYTRFEELRTRSGEVLFTREHKATISKDKANTYIDIDELKMFKDFGTSDKTTFKTKTKDKDQVTPKDEDKATPKTKTENKDKTTPKTRTEIEDKDILSKMNKRLEKVKAEVTNTVELIYESMCELQDEIYSDDSWLRLVELDKIDAITDEALNAVWNVICGENRRNPETIEIDKHKDIDVYVSKLTDIINHRIGLVNKMCEVIDQVMSEIKNEANMIDEKIYKASEMDNDMLHWIDDRLNNIIT